VLYRSRDVIGEVNWGRGSIFSTLTEGTSKELPIDTSFPRDSTEELFVPSPDERKDNGALVEW
jgi:hypothetical protein